MGIAVGAGIAIPYAAKLGLTPMTVTGLMCLFSATVLLWCGGWAVISSLRSIPARVLAVLGMLVAGYVVVFAVTLAVVATSVPPSTLDNGDPGTRGLAFSDVEFSTSDGVLLSGWYLPAGDGAAVALLHGSGSTRVDVLEQAEVLSHNGFGVLLFDARGHGGSTGQAMDFGWYGNEDVSAAIDFLAARPDVDPGRIAVVGMSMGGEEALGALASQPQIRAVVAEGATGRTAADREWLTAAYGLRGELQYGLDHVMTVATDLLTDASPPATLRESVAAATPRPVLLITAGTIPDETLAAEFIQGGSPATVQIWDVAGAGHVGGLATDPAGWERQVTGFLGAALR